MVLRVFNGFDIDKRPKSLVVFGQFAMDSVNRESTNVDYLFDACAIVVAGGDATAERAEEIVFGFVDDANIFKLRPLCSTDYKCGYIDLLSQLSVTGYVTQEMYLNTYNTMKNTPDAYYIIVIENTQLNQIVASGSLILEKKFIHSCGQRGRIEDIVVDSTYRGKQFGKTIVKSLIALSRILNCYKISLECNDSNVTWYSSMGFVREQGNSNHMQIRLEKS